MRMTHTNTLSLKEMMILINLADNFIVLAVNKDLFILPAHSLCTTCIPGALGVQKRVLDTLE